MKKQAARIIDSFEHASIRWLLMTSAAFATLSGFSATSDFSDLYERYPKYQFLWGFLDHPAWFFVLGVSWLVTAMATIVIRQRAPSRLSLAAERDRAQEAIGKLSENVQFTLDGLLINLSDRIALQKDGTSRISLYIHDGDQNCFVPCGRFSHNPMLKTKGRVRFSIDQGCIGKAWSNGWHFEGSIPSDRAAATEFHRREYGLKKAEAMALRMQSLQIAAKKNS